jgi:cysteinyl-tRNA synthetase
MHLGFKVRYVRNITDVGHLEEEFANEGEDKILRRARLEKLEPMEVVQYYTNRYHRFMDDLNVLSPSIEPHASAHIIEQQQMIKEILDKGFAYEVNGSVYFDLRKFDKEYGYGRLSGRVLSDMISNTRELGGQDEKRFPLDFALWKKADSSHIMRWASEWGEGYPGWHVECSAMGMKYLGNTIDIHGGGMDLIFPHHECEIAQSTLTAGSNHVKYWVHNNMVTINGQKMAKSKNNFITLEEIFTGNNALLEKAYSPMTIRFYILQAHYSGTLDFSNEALIAAEQGLTRLMKGIEVASALQPSGESTADVASLREKAYDAMSDDLNCPVVLAHLFEAARLANAVNDGHEKLNAADTESLRNFMEIFTRDLLGLKKETGASGDRVLDNVVKILIKSRNEAREKKDYALSDRIRQELANAGIILKDTKKGTEWSRE